MGVGSVADPERFDPEPDPSFQADTDAHKDPCVIFSVTMRGEGRGVRDKV